MSVKARMQINMMLEKDDEIDFTTNLKASVNLPIFWRETVSEAKFCSLLNYSLWYLFVRINYMVS